jgi:hypothetical protein
MGFGRWSTAVECPQCKIEEAVEVTFVVAPPDRSVGLGAGIDDIQPEPCGHCGHELTDDECEQLCDKHVDDAVEGAFEYDGPDRYEETAEYERERLGDYE